VCIKVTIINFTVTIKVGRCRLKPVFASTE
jgi:hypothetical protein